MEDTHALFQIFGNINLYSSYYFHGLFVAEDVYTLVSSTKAQHKLNICFSIQCFLVWKWYIVIQVLIILYSSGLRIATHSWGWLPIISQCNSCWILVLRPSCIPRHSRASSNIEMQPRKLLEWHSSWLHW